MGNNHSNKLNNNSNHNNLDINTSSNSSTLSNSKIDDQEYPQLGSVNVQLSWLATTNRNTQQTEITVNGKGALFHGSQLPSNDILNALSSVKLNPVTVPLLDSKAHHFLITYSNGWNAISSPEIFSRHSGTCIIIGDRSNIGKPYPIKVGDCFRLGSVGVVVSEVKNDRGIEQRLDTNRLQYLREEALAFEGDDEAALAADEEDLEKRKVEKTSHEGGLGENNAPFFCYMCYETHDTPEDHLVAPCECKGDTRYLHVQCLQKWYQSSVCGSKALVIRTTGNGAPACKICGAAYKTVFRNNGVKTNLLEMDHPGPYISLVVVTRHDTSPGLFNTKFRLNFGPGYRVGGLHSQLQEDPDLTPVELSIGRSSLCNMVLDYRTVSTVHAKLTYRNGQFYVQDSRSSNGTMVYLQGPLPLPNNETIRLRMGRSTLAIKAKRSFSATMRGALHRLPNSIPCTASLERLQEIMALAPAPLPRSIRLGADVEPQNLNNNNNNNNNNSVNNNYNSSNMATNLSNIDNINLNNNNNNNSNNNQQQLQQEQQEQVNISNLPEDNLSNQYISINRSDEIDQALILGPERRDGGSGHEKLDSPIHSQNSWHQTLSPNPLTKPLSQRSSSTSPPPQQQQQLQLHQSLSNQNLIIDNSNNVNNNNNNNNNNNGNLNEVDILKSESSLSSSTQNSNEINNKNNNKVILETNQRETIHISKINLSSCDESDNVSLVSGGGDSVSMVAVNSSINPLSAISTGPKIIHIPTHECDESVSNSDIQSNQAVASIQNISRALVSDIMSNTLKS